ncbi:PREDICTED: vegetative storage protein 2-like [Tarenaya hassleriana]|uniref:vegetative storage protein 2-like n=1 Tax=Tarenaya hassleriana TaxID=28532 RepID=UPI00053C2F0E|nr:PREDICTED: vegetative storage protein 2-like [Tarenaya hassleriana]
MKTLPIACLLFLATVTVCNARTMTVPELIEQVTDPDMAEQLRLSISYPNCRSWHLGVETNNIINFKTVPANCEEYVEDYLTFSDQYRADSKTICKEAYYYAKGLALKNDTVNVWIFDLDETLLSNIPFYQANGFGTESVDSEAFNKWISLGEAPVLGETLHLYNNLQKKGIKPVLITERYEELREITLSNLEKAGYTFWEKAIFKPTGSNAKIVNYKSKERKKLERGGYTIIGNIGDQWSDLQKESAGRRTFKLPNPLYYKT